MGAVEDLARLDAFAAKLRGGVEATAWPTIDPLPELREQTPQPFPFHALGPLLGPAAREIADAVQAPDALAAGSALAACAVATQPHAGIEMPHGQVAPLSLFVVTSAESGDRKSATDAIACGPIEEQRRRDARAHAMAMAAYKAAKASRKRRDPEEEPPIARSLVVSKGTIEGLHHLLKTQPHIGLFSTEGAELIGGHSMREERRSASIAWLLKAWSGETLDAMTRGDGLSVLIGRRVSMHVLLQPIILRGLLADPLATGQGWIARCLIAAPATLAGTRLWRDDAPPPLQRPEVIAYHRRLMGLLQSAPSLEPAGDGCELAPRAIRMTDAARAAWIEFYNACEEQQHAESPLAHARAWASKAAEQAARIAGILAIVQDHRASKVEEAAMLGGIETTSFYLAEHVRLMGLSQENTNLTRLYTLLAWLRDRGGEVKHAAVLQFTPRPLRELKAKGLLQLLEELAQRGYIRRRGDSWEVRQ